MEDRVGEYIARYRAAGLTGLPCTEAEVSALEQEVGILPEAYRAMLLLMGRNPDPRFTGTDVSIRWLRDMQPGAKELLEENGKPFELPPSAFVFLMHQGYQFMYFIAEDVSDDPTVYYYLEGNTVPERRSERFSDWLVGNTCK